MQKKLCCVVEDKDKDKDKDHWGKMSNESRLSFCWSPNVEPTHCNSMQCIESFLKTKEWVQ